MGLVALTFAGVQLPQPSRGVTNGTGSTANSYVGGLRACCTFGNTGGVSTDAFNIASVAHTGVGTYLITFTNALDSANFQVAFSKQRKADFPTFDTKTTTSVTLFNFNSAGTAAGKNR